MAIAAANHDAGAPGRLVPQRQRSVPGNLIACKSRSEGETDDRELTAIRVTDGIAFPAPSLPEDFSPGAAVVPPSCHPSKRLLEVDRSPNTIVTRYDAIFNGPSGPFITPSKDHIRWFAEVARMKDVDAKR